MLLAYRAFTNKIYRITLLLFIPVLMAFCCFLVQNGCFGVLGEGYSFRLSESLLIMGIGMTEVFMDLFAFGGIQSGNARHGEYLILSDKGERFLEKTLVIDELRRGLLIVAGFLMNMGIGIAFGDEVVKEDISFMILAMLWTYCISSLCILAARFSTNPWVNVLLAYIVSFFGILLLTLLIRTSLPGWLLGVVLFAVDVLISVLMVKIPVYKVKEKKYDK